MPPTPNGPVSFRCTATKSGNGDTTAITPRNAPLATRTTDFAPVDSVTAIDGQIPSEPHYGRAEGRKFRLWRRFVGKRHSSVMTKTRRRRYGLVHEVEARGGSDPP
jgi:hypothetical protein